MLPEYIRIKCSKCFGHKHNKGEPLCPSCGGTGVQLVHLGAPPDLAEAIANIDLKPKKGKRNA